MWIMTGGLGGPWVPDMTCALCPTITLSSPLTSPLLLPCSDPLSQKLWSVESGKALLRISAKFGPPSGPFSRDSSGEKITISIRVCGAVYRSLSAQIMAPDTIGRPSQFGKIVLTVF